MTLIIIIIAMIIVGLIIGALAGLIWKDNRPIGVQGDYLAAVITTVVGWRVGWFLITGLGVRTTKRLLGVIL